ncbi:MAG: hypothetical protein GY940_05775 [bacterium]|nr:hypothetical protein [bacterium]
MINDIKEILLLIGLAFRDFAGNLLSHLLYFFAVMAITIPVFFIGYRSFHSHSFFIGYLAVLVLLNFKIRNWLFFKHQLRLNARYVHFLAHKESFLQGGMTLLEVPRNNSQTVKQVRETAKKEGAGFLPNKLLAALTAIQIAGEAKEEPGKRMIGTGKSIAIKYLFLQLGTTLLLWTPFALISFLSSMNFSPVMQLFIHLLGFIFVYFLNTIILDPIISLLVQKKVKELLQ